MTDEEPNDASDDGPDEPQGAEAGPEGERRRRRRRRRRRGAEGASPNEPAGDASAATPAAAATAPSPAPTGGDPGRGDPGRSRRQYQQVHGPREAREADAAATEGTPVPAPSAPAPQGRTDRPPRERRERGGERREARGDRPQQPPRGGGSREGGGGRDRNRDRGERRGEGRGRGDGGPRRRDDAAPAPGPEARTAPVEARTPPVARLEQQRRPPSPLDDADEHVPETPNVAWGTDDDSPLREVVLAPDLPSEPADEDDPLTAPLADAPSAQLGQDVVSACGVRFVTGGRVSWFDAGDAEWTPGDRVLVDTERGQRLGWIATPPARRTVPGRDRMRRIVRRANEQDLRGERDGEGDRAHALRVAKDRAAALRLPLKVFRVELHGAPNRGGKLNVYYTCDERLDLRELIQQIGRELGVRVELRQLGVRDEAKAVGGIGSCGLTLCCTTWLPDFVPVSIKMAKDQGLVLSPTKVSGQCGRLKCCLVYEQAGYAELRKGLPKLGKRVIGARGEGRVVEVDVLRQRVRVSYGPGDTEVVPAAEVKPLFPSGNAPPQGRGGRREPEPELDDDASLETDDPSALVNLAPERVADEPTMPRDLPDEPADDPAGPDSDLADLASLPDVPPEVDPSGTDE